MQLLILVPLFPDQYMAETFSSVIAGKLAWGCKWSRFFQQIIQKSSEVFPQGQAYQIPEHFANESRIIWIACLITCKQKCYKRKDNDRIFDTGQSRQNENELNSKSYHFFQDLRMISMNSQEGRLQWNWEKIFCFYKIVQNETVQNFKDSPHYYSLEVWFINQWKQHKDSLWF